MIRKLYLLLLIAIVIGIQPVFAQSTASVDLEEASDDEFNQALDESTDIEMVKKNDLIFQQPAAEPEPEPVIAAETETATETEPEPAIAEETEAATDTEAEPVIAEETETAADTEPEPVIAAEPETAADTEPEPAIAAEPEPTADTEAEPVIAEETESAADTDTEPVIAAETETAADTDTEPAIAAEPETAADTEAEPVIAEETESATETEAEPVIAAETETADDTEAETPDSIRNNQYLQESQRLAGLAQEAYDYGDYDASNAFAQEAIRYAELSDEYVAEQTGAPVPKKASASDSNLLPATYTIRPWNISKDCFWNIAGRPWVYGDPHQWRKLYEANKLKLPNPNNPNLIEPGIVLDIPSLKGETRQGAWAEGKTYPPVN